MQLYFYYWPINFTFFSSFNPYKTLIRLKKKFKIKKLQITEDVQTSQINRTATTKSQICKSVKVLVAQLWPTLCDPRYCSPPGSSVHGILQARILWVAVPFSRGIFSTQGLNLHLLQCKQILSYLNHHSWSIGLQILSLLFTICLACSEEKHDVLRLRHGEFEILVEHLKGNI